MPCFSFYLQFNNRQQTKTSEYTASIEHRMLAANKTQ